MDKQRESATLGPMPQLTLPELDSLDPALDVFRAAPPVPAELLEAGLHPPLPVCGRRLVWGFALVAAARRAGLPGLECRQLAERPPAGMLSLALRLEGRAGAYRWSEKLGMLGFARSRGFSLGELDLLVEGRPDARLEEKLQEFACLPEALRGLVDEAALDLRTAQSVRGLPEPAFALACSSELSFSERRAFLGLLRDAALRGGLSPEETLAAAREALESGRPLEALRERACPELTAMRRRWTQLAEQLVEGSGVRLQPPENFEGDQFEASFLFRTRQALSRRLGALARVAERFDELAGFLR